MNQLKMLFVVGALASNFILGAQVEVNIIPGQGFTPNRQQVHAGDTVVFTNHTTKQHSVVADKTLVKDPNNVILPEGAIPFHSETLELGETFAQVFQTPGLYQYVCLQHEQFGMMGQIEVLP